MSSARLLVRLWQSADTTHVKGDAGDLVYVNDAEAVRRMVRDGQAELVGVQDTLDLEVTPVQPPGPAREVPRCG